jgi:hypothetical protein
VGAAVEGAPQSHDNKVKHGIHVHDLRGAEGIFCKLCSTGCQMRPRQHTSETALVRRCSFEKETNDVGLGRAFISEINWKESGRGAINDEIGGQHNKSGKIIFSSPYLSRISGSNRNCVHQQMAVTTWEQEGRCRFGGWISQTLGLWVFDGSGRSACVATA